MIAMTSQMTSSNRGDPSDLAIPAGTRKIPTAIIPLITIAVAGQRPN